MTEEQLYRDIAVEYVLEHRDEFVITTYSDLILLDKALGKWSHLVTSRAFSSMFQDGYKVLAASWDSHGWFFLMYRRSE